MSHWGGGKQDGSDSCVHIILGIMRVHISPSSAWMVLFHVPGAVDVERY